jgi:hypothetical protein
MGDLRAGSPRSGRQVLRTRHTPQGNERTPRATPRTAPPGTGPRSERHCAPNAPPGTVSRRCRDAASTECGAMRCGVARWVLVRGPHRGDRPWTATSGHDRTGAAPEKPHRPIQEIAPEPGRHRPSRIDATRTEGGGDIEGYAVVSPDPKGASKASRRCTPIRGRHRRRTDGAPGAGTPESNDSAYPGRGCRSGSGGPARWAGQAQRRPVGKASRPAGAAARPRQDRPGSALGVGPADRIGPGCQDRASGPRVVDGAENGAVKRCTLADRVRNSPTTERGEPPAPLGGRPEPRPLTP